MAGAAAAPAAAASAAALVWPRPWSDEDDALLLYMADNFKVHVSREEVEASLLPDPATFRWVVHIKKRVRGVATWPPGK
jgi:hypothetical protein